MDRSLGNDLPERIDNFIDRGNLFNEIDSIYTQHQSILLHASSGSGKSTVANEYAHRILKDYTIRWINSSTVDRVCQKYFQIAKELNLNVENRVINEILVLNVNKQLSKLAHIKFFLIFDNIENDSNVCKIIRKIVKNLPQNVHVLLTAKKIDQTLKGLYVKEVPLRNLTRSEAALFILNELEHRLSKKVDELNLILNSTVTNNEFIPVKLIKIVAILKYFNTEPIGALLKSKTEDNFLIGLFNDIYLRDPDYKYILTTFSLMDKDYLFLDFIVSITGSSREKVNELVSQLKKIGLISTYNQETFWINLDIQNELKLFIKSIKFDEKESFFKYILYKLRMDLIENKTIEFEKYYLHIMSLLDHIRTNVQNEENNDKLNEIVLYWLISTMLSNNFIDYKKVLAYLERELDLEKEVDCQQRIHATVHSIGLAYYYMGNYKKSIELFNLALDIVRKYESQNNKDVAIIENGLAFSYRNSGDLKHALELYNKVLDYYKKLDKIDKIDGSEFLEIFVNIGNIHQELGDHKLAIEFYTEFLSIHESEDKITARTLFNIALAYLSINDHQKSIEYFNKSLVIYRKIIDENDPVLGYLYFGLGNALCKAGDNKTAIENLNHSLDINKNYYQDNNCLISEILCSLGNAYRAMGEPRKSVFYFTDSLEIIRLDSVINQKNLFGTLLNLASVHQELGEHENSIKYYKEALDITTDDKNFIEKEEILLIIGNLYNFTGEFEKAIDYYIKSLEMYKNLKPDDSEFIAGINYNLGLTYFNLSDYEKAIVYYLDSLEISKQLNDSQKTSDTMIGLANSYIYIGQLKKAIPYFNDSLHIFEQSNNKNSTMTYVLDNLASVHLSLGEIEKGIEFYNLSLSTKKQIFQDNHPSTDETLYALGNSYSLAGQFDKSIECFKDSLEIKKKIYAHNHPSIAVTCNNIGWAYQNLKEFDKAIQYYNDSLHIYKVFYDDKYNEIAHIINNIGIAYMNLAEYQKSIDYFNESLKLYKRVYQVSYNPLIETILSNIEKSYNLNKSNNFFIL